MDRAALLVSILVVVVIAVIFALSLRRPQAQEGMPLPQGGRSQEKKLLISPIAGSWYPGETTTLRQLIEEYLAKAELKPLEGDICSLISPHAGYQYSGAVAAYGYKAVSSKKFKRVIVLGLSHSYPFAEFLALPTVTHFVTPLGEIPLDQKAIEILLGHPCFRRLPEPWRREHSVDIQLPFLQVVLGDFLLVPLLARDLTDKTRQQAAAALRSIVDPQTLVVASTDFTHYGNDYDFCPFPVAEAAEKLRELDLGAFAAIEKKNAKDFLDYCEKTGATVCGRLPVAILLEMLPPEAQAHLLKYDTSGRMANDYERSVSYISAAFIGTWRKGESVTAQPPSALAVEDRQRLLALARATIAHYLKTQRTPEPKDLGIEVTPAMSKTGAAFVTLTKAGELRGCIGEIFATQSLYKSVIANAIHAAVDDPRFPAVTADELPALHVEISALTEPQEVPSYRDIVIGKHGIVLRKAGRSAVYLPQVAPEQGWDLETTLNHLSRKAGLPSDAWKEGASFLVFEAVVFGEDAK